MNSYFFFNPYDIQTKGIDRPYEEQIEILKKEIETADAILIGAGAGLSTAAGLTYSGDRFDKYFFDFRDKYGIRDIYSGGFYPFPTEEEYWAWWSRHIYFNRYIDAPSDVYPNLLKLVKNKDYFILTTNVDHQFQRAGFSFILFLQFSQFIPSTKNFLLPITELFSFLSCSLTTELPPQHPPSL